MGLSSHLSLIRTLLFFKILCRSQIWRDFWIDFYKKFDICSLWHTFLCGLVSKTGLSKTWLKWNRLFIWSETKVQYKREEIVEDLTEEDLEKQISIDLSETDTIWLLDMPGVCVSLESEEAVSIREENARYTEVWFTMFSQSEKISPLWHQVRAIAISHSCPKMFWNKLKIINQVMLSCEKGIGLDISAISIIFAWLVLR